MYTSQLRRQLEERRDFVNQTIVPLLGARSKENCTCSTRKIAKSTALSGSSRSLSICVCKQANSHSFFAIIRARSLLLRLVFIVCFLFYGFGKTPYTEITVRRLKQCAFHRVVGLDVEKCKSKRL